jgi:hypothetical protein
VARRTRILIAALVPLVGALAGAATTPARTMS